MLINFSNTLPVSSLEDGVYFLKLTDTENRVAVRKFIKE
ncbi:T9SS type A sorting domain-containing protein [Kordia sp. YSTF-M3]|uniref:T9SS type A sorting domain-containing protein n=1 Tax=Kordia aestuariivivens TaxID=2759037 RepID=A0ABR7Q9G4_9FLAO|nr:T9SS type A sorting domain-containing protein [Kordia aestuariivivens]